MRIIAGTCKGRPLKAVKGISTRPTTDKVKESIFNIIGPFFDGGIGLDLYAGSGGLGLEALSRGIEKVIFVDKDNKAISTIRENVKRCQFEHAAEIYRNDALRALHAITKRDLKFSIVFLDPPYKEENIATIISIISDHELLDDHGVIVAEHDSTVTLPQQIGKFKQGRNEHYGTTTITIYTK